MIDISKAIKLVQKHTAAIGVQKIAIDQCIGRVLAEPIIADSDLPPFDRSQMDGYAVKAADTDRAPITLKLVGESAAGSGWHNTIKSGEAVRIMTGAPVPKGADAVQKVELTSEDNGSTVKVLAPVKSDQFIVGKGSEIRKGKTVLRSGEIITDNMISCIAAFGYAKVQVGKQPRIAIMGTGSEIVDIAKKPGIDQIRNSNSVMLATFCRRHSAVPTVLPNVKDDLATLKAEIRSAVRKQHILVITGGVSVGKYDHTKTALSELGAEIFFDKLRLKPGKPAVFARLGKCLIFGLPGNPVSAAVTFNLFVRTAIRLMQGSSNPQLRGGTAVLTRDAKAAAERDSYYPAALSTDDAGLLTAEPLRWQGSSDLIGFSRAEALIVLGRGVTAAAGQPVPILYL